MVFFQEFLNLESLAEKRPHLSLRIDFFGQFQLHCGVIVQYNENKISKTKCGFLQRGWKSSIAAKTDLKINQ